ncbi:pilin [Paenibacillus sp. FSL K6-3166]|uniref:pilin n=1 Tax=unclassified Paenibacillus TaxID=185978 RepID=UPI0030FC5E86
MGILKTKRFWFELFLVMVVCFTFAAVAHATTLNPTNGDALKETIKGGSTKAVEYFRYCVGFLAVAFIVWAGILFLTANGDSQKIQAGKERIKWTIGAVVLVILADKIVGVVYGIIPDSTPVDPGTAAAPKK